MVFKSDLNEIEDSGVSSKINAAGLINLTLERLWIDSYNAMANGNYFLWNIKLDSIWAILGGDETEDSEIVKQFNDLDLKIHENGGWNKGSKGFVIENKGNMSLQYLLLRNKSIFLRRLQNKQGKGTAYDDGSADYMD
jgi:hypothetical protein